MGEKGEGGGGPEWKTSESKFRPRSSERGGVSSKKELVEAQSMEAQSLLVPMAGDAMPLVVWERHECTT